MKWVSIVPEKEYSNRKICFRDWDDLMSDTGRVYSTVSLELASQWAYLLEAIEIKTPRLLVFLRSQKWNLKTKFKHIKYFAHRLCEKLRLPARLPGSSWTLTGLCIHYLQMFRIWNPKSLLLFFNHSFLWYRTCLHWACKRNHGQVVSYLLKSGADKEILTTKGEMPVQLTSRREIRKIMGGESVFGGTFDFVRLIEDLWYYWLRS